ncbi:integral membrane protein [Corynebacterium spheniscorum]|uniref:Integral membrane protein n=1 Tax=Corynebacterium spheniscorum TaxID=185761 RepID=A0A1I2QCM6_9CORY|nr:integral membrane protein [Corynebacterium spheniscorum]
MINVSTTPENTPTHKATPQASVAATPRAPHPERQHRVAIALKIFSATAWITGVMLLLLCMRMIMQYILKLDLPSWATIVAIVHGWAYMAYLVASVNLGIKARWQPITWFTTVIAGVVPFLSFFVEAWRRREVKERFQLS